MVISAWIMLILGLLVTWGGAFLCIKCALKRQLQSYEEGGDVTWEQPTVCASQNLTQALNVNKNETNPFESKQ